MVQVAILLTRQGHEKEQMVHKDIIVQPVAISSKIKAKDGNSYPSEIEKFYDIFIEPNQVTEIRQLNTGYKDKQTISGYYNKKETFVRDAIILSGYKNVYTVLNPINPDLFARSPNSYQETKTTTSDNAIIKRNWLYVDIDPDIEKGISARDSQRKAPYQAALDVRKYLRSKGFTDPVVIDSGNGYSLYYRIDLPNSPEALALVSGALDHLKQNITGDGFIIDTTVCNASRICKITGTKSCKGADLPDQPHRLSQFLEIPASISIIPIDKIQSLLLNTPVVIKPASFTGKLTQEQAEQFFKDSCKLDIDITKNNANCITYITTCPFEDDNHNAYCYYFPESKVIGYKCFHARCSGRNLKFLCDKCGVSNPNGTDKDYCCDTFTDSFPDVESYLNPLPGDSTGLLTAMEQENAILHSGNKTLLENKIRECQEQLRILNGNNPDKEQWQARPIRWDKVVEKAKNQENKWIVDKLLNGSDLSLITGLPFSGKTTIMVNLMIKIMQGSGDFFGYPVARSCPVIYLNADCLPEDIIMEKFLEYNPDIKCLQDNFFYDNNLPSVITTDSLLAYLEYMTKELGDKITEGAVFVIDTLRSAFLGESESGTENDNTAMVNILKPIRKWCLDNRCNVIVLHHNAKSTDEFAGAGGILGAVNNYWNVHRGMTDTISTVNITTRREVMPPIKIIKTKDGLAIYNNKSKEEPEACPVSYVGRLPKGEDKAMTTKEIIANAIFPPSIFPDLQKQPRMNEFLMGQVELTRVSRKPDPNHKGSGAIPFVYWID